MSNSNKVVLIIVGIPVIYIIGLIYFLYFPKSVDVYTSGQYEDLILGESKSDLIARLKNTNHSFAPKPLDPERKRNWVSLDSMDEKEYRYLLKSNKWNASRIGYEEGCGSPITTMYFESNNLVKIRVECWMSL